jgi:ABC-type Na+ efflux pump permease subunit
MNVSWRRIRAVIRKELREYRRNRSILLAMGIFPLIFLIQPLAAVFVARGSSAESLSRLHLLLYMLGIPILTPTVLAAYSVAGERQQGSLEPILSTPIRREEYLLGKAIAALLPAVLTAYGVYAVFIALVALFADPAVSAAIVRAPDVLVQVVATPLLAALSIWIGIAISSRTGDVRVAQQLSLLGVLPILLVTSLVAFDVIHASPGIAIGAGIALLAADVAGWRVVAPLFDRERLITKTP